MRITVDGRAVDCGPEESLLEAMLRAGFHPTGGGCLCLAGDCSRCLVAVEGVSYVRSCQTAVRDGLDIRRHHLGAATPPLPATPQGPAPAATRHLHCDVVVIGQGPSGRAAADESRAAGRRVVTLEARAEEEAIGIYPGPLVVARTPAGTLQVHVGEEVVVATGTAEIQPVVPGSELDGLLTARAAERLAAAGFDLGRLVAVGRPPRGLESSAIPGELVRFEGEGRVEAVVVRDESGERRHECDTASVGLGLYPRDALARMGNGLPVRVVGDAAGEPEIPSCPPEGVVCPCSEVSVADLESVWERGFCELELVKRATLAGTGTCQGSTCVPYVRSFLRDRGKRLQPAFTARPVTRQLTLGEIAAGAHHHPTSRTPLHEEHLALGATMERSGGWWRPWAYGDVAAERAAVRRRVSLGDVSTLGKFRVTGPDATAFLDRLYPTRVSTLKPGRSRYALLLDERGYVLDDGMICRDETDGYHLTLTSAGSTFGELWLRDWAEAGGYDVRLVNQTMSLGAVNVTGPLAAELLARAGAEELPGFARHGEGRLADIDCRMYRLSFTGELSYELHHAAADSVALWRRLLELGADLGVAPHGLAALLDLRLEKGHIIVGQDSDYDSTPRRIHHQWAVKLDKEDFVGREAVLRTDRVPLDRRLVGLAMESPAPIEGAVVYSGDRWVGNVTSSAESSEPGRAVMLAWLHLVDGELPETVTIDGRRASRVALPFYDPEGARARAPVAAPGSEGGKASFEPVARAEPRGRFERLEAVRVTAVPEAVVALDGASGLALRLAPDEILVLGSIEDGAVADPHAVVQRETGFSGVWLESAEAARIVERECAWEPPEERPAFAQGALAGIPVKLHFERERVLLVVQTPWARELEERLW